MLSNSVGGGGFRNLLEYKNEHGYHQGDGVVQSCVPFGGFYGARTHSIGHISPKIHLNVREHAQNDLLLFGLTILLSKFYLR